MKDGTALPSWITFDNTTVTFTLNPTDNALIGIYDLSMHATIVPDTIY